MYNSFFKQISVCTLTQLNTQENENIFLRQCNEVSWWISHCMYQMLVLLLFTLVRSSIRVNLAISFPFFRLNIVNEVHARSHHERIIKKFRTLRSFGSFIHQFNSDSFSSSYYVLLSQFIHNINLKLGQI